MALGVFCIESWSSDLRVKGTIRPLLSFLEATSDLNVIHQRISSADELFRYIDVWSTSYHSYPVGFLAMHGDTGEVLAGADRVTIEELLDAAEDERSIELKGKILYLGSCSTLKTHPERMAALCKKTRARVVCGYARDVHWHEAAAFEVLLFSALAQHLTRPSAALRRLARDFPDHLERLQFRTFPDYTGRRSAPNGERVRRARHA